MLKRVDTAVYEFVQQFGDGEAPAGVVTYDIKSGGIDYATSGGFVDDIAAQLDEYKAKIETARSRFPLSAVMGR